MPHEMGDVYHTCSTLYPLYLKKKKTCALSTIYMRVYTKVSRLAAWSEN